MAMNPLLRKPLPVLHLSPIRFTSREAAVFCYRIAIQFI